MLEALNSDGCSLIELLRNAPGDAVQLDAVDFGVRHAFRLHPEEIADAAARLQNVALSETHIFQCLIHSTDHHGRGVERGQGRFSCRSILFIGQHRFQFSVMGVILLKELR